jgi:hypothetical protein
MVSYSTAVPYSNTKPIINRIEKIEDYLSYLKDIKNNDQIFKKYPSSIIGNIIGIFYIIAGLISLFFTALIIMMGFVAIIFNPGGIFVFLMAIFPAILTIIFLGGGLSLLINNNPITEAATISFLSFVLLITWIALRINGTSFIDVLNAFIHYIFDFIVSIINNPKLKNNVSI